MSLQASCASVTHQTFEMKLLEHCRISEHKEAYFYRIGSAALLMMEVATARQGPSWCVCNVILLHPNLIGRWNPEIQTAWEQAISAALQRGARRLEFVFHWHRTNLLVTEENQTALEEMLTEQFASTIH